ncbi:hypothetical protein F5Y10DRAFT_102609 [Nemania abortiva]|nr:hypothetical protein F5Y10DRAFT_102609 [Nemania abortiva]
MSARILVGVLAIARIAVATSSSITHSYAPIPTHSVQLDLDFVEEEFKKAGSNSTIEINDSSPAAITDYTGPTSYSAAAINAPINCASTDTYDGLIAWFDGEFDAGRCADACTARTTYNLANGFTTRPCRFFNTYVLNKGGVIYAQNCALYTQRWADTYATNSGQVGSDGSIYTITQSVGYYLTDDAGPCQP